MRRASTVNAIRMAVPLPAPGIHYPDEVMQSLEQAHRLVFGYGLVPREFRDGARSSLHCLHPAS
jgi:hypothetical protein